jgi:hypothetical protein
MTSSFQAVKIDIRKTSSVQLSLDDPKYHADNHNWSMHCRVLDTKVAAGIRSVLPERNCLVVGIFCRHLRVPKEALFTCALLCRGPIPIIGWISTKQSSTRSGGREVKITRLYELH